MAEEKHGVEVVLMGHLSEARCLDDDWTGLTKRSERKKRQNRLNVRAHRKRKALEKNKLLQAAQESSSNYSVGSSSDTQGSQGSVDANRSPALAYLPMVICGKRTFKHDIENGLVHPRFSFYPLTQDHSMPLIEYNVIRAALTNIAILNLLEVIVPPTCRNNYENLTLFPPPVGRPSSLESTETQRWIPHEAWIDVLPCPQMRDNIIKAGHLVDKREFCRDLIGSLFPGSSSTHKAGVIVWNDPWHISGWELTAEFIKKWRFTLLGCYDLMRATNRWREIRQEKPFSMGVVMP